MSLRFRKNYIHVPVPQISIPVSKEWIYRITMARRLIKHYSLYDDDLIYNFVNLYLFLQVNMLEIDLLNFERALGETEI